MKSVSIKKIAKILDIGIDKAASTATLNHFVLSCRAARKLIEQAYFERIVSHLHSIGISKFVIKCAITQKNSLLRSSLDDFSKDNTTWLDQSHYTITIDTTEYEPKYSSLMNINL